MPLPICWTPLLDGELRRLRADGASWDAIARAFGMSRNTALERGRRLGFGRNPLAPPEPLPLVAPRRARRVRARDELDIDAVPLHVDRPPLRAGHGVTWGAITSGTPLAGIAYPPWSLDQAARGPHGDEPRDKPRDKPREQPDCDQPDCDQPDCDQPDWAEPESDDSELDESGWEKPGLVGQPC
jgi:hypothetical protein